MKIAIVTLGFNSSKPGGVSGVVLRMIASLRDIHELEILSFANESKDQNSIQILNPLSYKRVNNQESSLQGIKIWTFGTIGSEFEFLRYRKRRDLKSFLETFDAIIVVTGFLQVANIIPKIKTPIFIQCATRLIWERKSQYAGMCRFKRIFLKVQLPFLMAQEKKVLLNPSVFLAENSRMKLWLEENSSNTIQLWYPGTPSKITSGISPINYDSNSHFVSVGRFNEPRKGWDRLFIAYKKAYLEDSSIPPLLVIGWGEFSSRDRDVLVEAQEACPILVLHDLTNEDRDAKLKTASFFLQASHEEGLGLAALEALSFGVPLICSATDGSREYVIEGVSGMLVEQSSEFVEDFSKAIILSQTLEYDDLHRSSLELFYQAFDLEISKHKLVKIISSQIEECNLCN